MLDEKLGVILDTIKDIGTEDQAVGQILMEGFGISLNILKEVSAKGNRDVINMDEQLEVVTTILGFSLEELVRHILDTRMNAESTKEVDQETLNFITSDVDDYEKFLSENKIEEVKDTINTLDKLI